MIPRPARNDSRRVKAAALLISALAVALALPGCAKKEAEVEPVVSVQVQPATRAAISEIVSADAVVFPVEQAVITPKITSTIKTFEVQRGSRVHKGQLLAVLENADLAAAADQSKGEFQQAEAGYATTTGASLPQELQKATLDASVAKSALDAQQKVYDSRKTLFDQGALPRRDFDTAQVALAQARNQYEVAQRQLDDLKRIGQEQSIKSATGQMARPKENISARRPSSATPKFAAPSMASLPTVPYIPANWPPRIFRCLR